MSDQWKIMVTPIKGGTDTYVQRGDFHANQVCAMDEMKDWLRSYAHAKIEKVEGWEKPEPFGICEKCVKGDD